MRMIQSDWRIDFSRRILYDYVEEKEITKKYDRRRQKEMNTLHSWYWLVFSADHFCNQRGTISVVESMLYAGFYRPMWAACIVWLIYMCSTGRARKLFSERKELGKFRKRPSRLLSVVWRLSIDLLMNYTLQKISFAGPIRWILSRPNFIILSRLSLSFYLMQTPLLFIRSAMARTTISFSYYQIVGASVFGGPIFA